LHLELRKSQEADPIVRLAFGPDQDSLVVDPGAAGLAVVAEIEDLAVFTGLDV